MPNYSLILDTKFRPFSYDELIKPAIMQTQAHQALEEEYGNLATKANVWESIANEQSDPYAYKMYKTYSEDLENMADQLARSGLDPTSRRNMLNMRSRYSSEILPIETAYKRREELAAEQRKAIGADKTLRYQRMAGQMSLDDFIKNPSLDYGESYSGALLAKQVSEAASNYAKVLTKEGGLERLGLPYQYKSRIGYGASPEEILAVINDAALDGHQGAVDFLRGIRDQVIASSGISDWADPITKKEFESFANLGLYSALGQTAIKNYTDSYSMQNGLRLAANRDAAVAAEQQRLKIYNINPVPLYGTSEVSVQNTATLDLLNKFRDKGYFNSEGKLTSKGLKALQDAKYIENERAGLAAPSRYQVGDWEFKNWALAHGHSQEGIDAGHYSPSLDRYYQNTISAINRGELVTGTPNISVYRQAIKDKSTSDFLLKKTTAALGGGDIYKVGSLTHSDTGIRMDKGDKMSSDDFEKLATDNPILYIINSPTTDNQLIELSNGDMFIMPSDMLDIINKEKLTLANKRVRGSASSQEAAVNLNQANSYLGSLLDWNEGTGIATSEGTIMF